MGMIRRLEILLRAFFISFRYRVAFFRVAVQINVTMLRLFVVIMYLGGMIVLFSYSFILKDIKVSFAVNAVNIVLVLLFVAFLERERTFLSPSLDLIEVYDARASVLGYRRVLLYAVLGVCLSLCLRAKVLQIEPGG